MSLCAEADPWSTMCPICVWSCHDFPLGVVLVELWCGLKPSLDVLVLRALGINSCGQMSDVVCDYPWLPVRGYKAIHDWYLPLEGLSLCEGGHAAYQSCCLPIPTMRHVMKRPKAPCDLIPPFRHLLGSFTKRASNNLQVVWVWSSMSHQVGVSDVNQVDTDSNSVPLMGQKLLSKSLRVHQGQPPSTWVL